jgi:hypothetical protein
VQLVMLTLNSFADLVKQRGAVDKVWVVAVERHEAQGCGGVSARSAGLAWR